MKVPYFIPWITKKEKTYVNRALDQRWLTNGSYLKKFEEKIASLVEAKYAIGVSSATHGLHLILQSLKIGPGDEVIVPSLTFAATADVVSYCGAEPILADVDPETFNILPSEILKRVTKKTKAIIVVHYGGQACDMNDIEDLAKKYGLYIIEDCAHALGSKYKNKMCGSIGIGGCFSFYPTKIITTGEGGMITTNSDKISKKSKSLRSHGMSILPTEREKIASWKYDINEIGFNYRLDEIRSALGLSQVSRIATINKSRIKIAKKYNKELSKKKGISIPFVKQDRNHIYHLYTIKVEKDYHLTRDELFHRLYEKGIGTSVQYLPLHLLSYNKKKYGVKSAGFKNCNRLKDQILCLPIYPTMTSKHIDYVISSI